MRVNISCLVNAVRKLTARFVYSRFVPSVRNQGNILAAPYAIGDSSSEYLHHFLFQMGPPGTLCLVLMAITSYRLVEFEQTAVV